MPYIMDSKQISFKISKGATTSLLLIPLEHVDYIHINVYIPYSGFLSRTETNAQQI